MNVMFNRQFNSLGHQQTGTDQEAHLSAVHGVLTDLANQTHHKLSGAVSDDAGDLVGPFPGHHGL